MTAPLPAGPAGVRSLDPKPDQQLKGIEALKHDRAALEAALLAAIADDPGFQETLPQGPSTHAGLQGQVKANCERVLRVFARNGLLEA